MTCVFVFGLLSLESIEQLLRGQSLPLSLVGLSYRGVSVNDCIHNAFTTIDDLLERVSHD